MRRLAEIIPYLISHDMILHFVFVTSGLPRRRFSRFARLASSQ